MSSELQIALDNVWKSYEKNSTANSFATSLKQKSAVETIGNSQKRWALRDIDLVIKGGEAVGIFGRNGAGKSTLLGILSGTLDHTAGRVHRSGRIAPLLQLTAWIDKNLTGQQNLETFCALFGLRGSTRREIIEQAENFADLGKFFSAPCRTYSSGMIARLAFAAALHAPSDFLVIDEVLAVGDAGFREKCHNVLRQRVEEGCGLILVSQNPSAVMTLVSRGIILEQGAILFDGAINTAAEQYLELMESKRRRSSLVQELAELAGDRLELELQTFPECYVIKIAAKDQRANQPLTLRGEIYHHRGVCVSKFIDQAVADETGHVLFQLSLLRHMVSGSYILNFEIHSDDGLLEEFPRAFRLDVVNEKETGGLVDLSMSFVLTSENGEHG